MRLMFAMLCVLATKCALADLRYRVTNLGTLANGISVAFDANSTGKVVGGSWTGIQINAFRWDGTMVDLGPGDGYSYGNGINDSGIVVGSFNPFGNGIRPCKWTNGSFQFLPALNPNDLRGAALKINSSGTIAGYSDAVSGGFHACLWNTSGVQDMGTLPGDNSSQANDINNSGDAAGWSRAPSNGRRIAVAWRSGVIESLGTLGGTNSEAHGINSIGQVVGQSQTTGNATTRAVLWTSGEMIDLGTIGTYSIAQAISDDGKVVGYSSVSGALRAFIWDGEIRDLNELLHPDSQDWILEVAYGINSSGQIVGQGTIDGESRAFIATPDFSNHAPAANDATYATAEDTAVSITLTAADIDEDPLTFSIVTQPQHGILTGTPPNLTYTPNQNFNGPDTFNFKANDGELDSNIATITINVSAVNDAPIVSAPTSVTTNQGSTAPFTLGVSDVDVGANRVRVSLVVSHGTLNLVSTQGLIFISGVADFTGSLADVNAAMSNVTYRHTPGYFGSDTLTFTVSDQGFTGSGGALSDSKSVPITIIQQSPIIFGPTSYIIHEGFEFTGGLAVLMVSDNQYLSVFSDDSSLGAQIEFLGTSFYRIASEVRFRLEHNVARAGIAYNVELYNYTTQNWEIGTGDVAPTSDSTFDVVVTTTANNYINSTTGQVRGLVTWTPINDEDPAQDGWLHNVDLASWRVKP